MKTYFFIYHFISVGLAQRFSNRCYRDTRPYMVCALGAAVKMFLLIIHQTKTFQEGQVSLSAPAAQVSQA